MSHIVSWIVIVFFCTLVHAGEVVKPQNLRVNFERHQHALDIVICNELKQAVSFYYPEGDLPYYLWIKITPVFSSSKSGFASPLYQSSDLTSLPPKHGFRSLDSGECLTKRVSMISLLTPLVKADDVWIESIEIKHKIYFDKDFAQFELYESNKILVQSNLNELGT